MGDRRVISNCDSFYDFMLNIKEWYGSMIAFETVTQQWTYNDLYRLVSNASSVIKTKDTIYCIDVKNPLLFFVAFMAVTISGNIAWLNEKAAYEQYIYISDDKVKKMIENNITYEMKNKYENDRVSVVAQSSGTTSISKGVMLSQKNILTDMVAGVREYNYPKGAVYYKVLPYQHLFGLVADLLGPLYSGGTICYSDDQINFFKYLKIFKPTHMNLPPIIVSMIEKMLLINSDLKEVTGGKLKKIMCAGAPIERETQVSLKKYGIDVFSAYGLTECSPCISMNSTANHKNGSVGKILEGVNVKIKDNEILVNGSTVMLGYWNDPQATSSVFKDGWLVTGDLGYIDDEGFLYLTGRKSNLIVFEDGTKLSPEKFESEINCIKNVKECIVYPLKKKERTVINVKVVTEADQHIQLINKIEKIACEMQLSSKLQKIEFSKDELEKNKLGKIIRRI